MGILLLTGGPTRAITACFFCNRGSKEHLCFQKVREKAITIFEKDETKEYGAACLNHIMITCKRLNFRKEHTEVLVKNNFMSKQGNWFYRNFHQKGSNFSLEFIRNLVELIWDGTNESIFNNELFIPECDEIIDQHFAMLLKLSEQNDTNTSRVKFPFSYFSPKNSKFIVFDNTDDWKYSMSFF